MMVKIITLYNHKGGVSKTTTTFNLAHLLAESGHNVLVIDADPQCNMTELLMAKAVDKADEEEVETGKEIELPGTSLLTLLKPRLDGAVPEVSIESVQVVSICRNLDLIRGDVGISAIEDALGEAHSQRFSTKTHEKRTYVALGDFLIRFGEAKKYKYILLDVGPSSGSLTRSCFLACDAFFVPVAPDRFNVQAIGTLSAIIDRWINEHGQVYEDFRKLGLPIRHGKPQFLGTIVQHFKRNKGKPKPSFTLWMGRIPKAVLSKLLPTLKKYSSIERDLTSKLTADSVTAAEIPDFGGLGPIMQEFGKPVFNLRQEDTKIATESGIAWSGQTWTDAQRRMEEFKLKLGLIQKSLNLIL